jgi:hypothetical protein
VARVLVIHREPAEAAEFAARLRDRGVDAQPYLTLGARGFRGIRGDPPDAILIDLNRAPSYGRTMGALLRESAALRAIPLVFIAGEPQMTAATKRMLPDAVYAPWNEVPAALGRAICFELTTYIKDGKVFHTPRVSHECYPTGTGVDEKEAESRTRQLRPVIQ